MNFPLDDSTQTNTVLLTTGTSSTYVDSNDLSTKQNVLDASTNLLGIGTSIRDLNYNNITINKPTKFQSDWNSTIINKPTNFQSDWNSTIINKPDLTVYAIKSNVDTSLNTINSTLSNKQNTLTFTTPLIKDVSNNVTINLSSYLLSSTASSTYATISTLNTKQNTISVSTPLIKDVSNNITIGLSGYLLSSTANSTYATISNLNTIQNTISVSTPLIKDVSNNITIDLSNCALKTNVDISLSLINTNIATKQNYFTCITPLIKNDVSNNITIDLSAYDTIALRNTALGSYLLSSTASSTYATISNLNTKENALTFSTPLTRAVNNITIDLSAYPLKTYVDGSLNTINTSFPTFMTIGAILPQVPDSFKNPGITVQTCPCPASFWAATTRAPSFAWF